MSITGRHSVSVAVVAGSVHLRRRAEKVIAVEGCFINCSLRMMAGVLPELQPAIVRADLIYNLDLPFGIDEVPDEMFTVYAYQVAEQIVKDHVRDSGCCEKQEEKSTCIAGGCAPKRSGGCGE